MEPLPKHILYAARGRHPQPAGVRRHMVADRAGHRLLAYGDERAGQRHQGRIHRTGQRIYGVPHTRLCLCRRGACTRAVPIQGQGGADRHRRKQGEGRRHRGASPRHRQAHATVPIH